MLSLGLTSSFVDRTGLSSASFRSRGPAQLPMAGRSTGLATNFRYAYFNFHCVSWMPSWLVEQRGRSLERSNLYSFFSFAGIAAVALQ